MFVSSINQTIDSKHVSGAWMILRKQRSFRWREDRGQRLLQRGTKKEKQQWGSEGEQSVTRCDWYSLPKEPQGSIFSVSGRHVCCYPWSYQVSSGCVAACACAQRVFWGAVLLHFSQQADKIMKRCWPTFCSPTFFFSFYYTYFVIP